MLVIQVKRQLIMNNEGENKERKVRWTKQIFDKSLTTQFDTTKKIKPSFSKIKGHIIKYLRNKDYTKLSEWINKVLPDDNDLINFFDAEGDSILKYALAYFKDLEILEFIKEHFPIVSIQFSLRKSQFAVLDEFFASQAGAELFEEDDIVYREERIEKFKFLLNVDAKTVKEFVDNKQDKKYFTRKVREDLSKAEMETKQNNPSSMNCQMTI